MKNIVKLFGIIAISAIIVFAFFACDDGTTDEQKVNNTINTATITGTASVGTTLYSNVKNMDGYNATGVSYKWQRADTQFSTFTNINNVTSSNYALTVDDTNKYVRVEVINSDTSAPVLSNSIGPIDTNQVAKPTIDPNGGNVVSGQEISLDSTTTGVTIRYTLDGSTPSATNGSTYRSYSKPTITTNCTFKAIATRYDMVDSEILSVSFTVVAAPAFSAVTSSATTFSSGIYSIAYGNSRYVAGGNVRMAYSTNGTTWTDCASPSNGFPLVRGIVYGTQFVAVGEYYSGGQILYSTDGSTWNNVTTSSFGTSYIKDVAYGNGTYVAVGEDGKIAYSSNGSTWTQVTTTQFDTSTIYGITYGNGRFIAVGASGKMAYSTNGSNWTAVSDSKFSTSTIRGITYGGSAGNEIFIAVGGSYIAYSTDGLTWTRATTSYYNSGLFSTGLNRVTWGGNKYVIVASSGIMLYSVNGIQWAQIDGGTGTGKSQFDDTGSYSSINDIVYAGGRFVAVGVKNNDILGVGTGEMATGN